jgi:hypothetical protein
MKKIIIFVLAICVLISIYLVTGTAAAKTDASKFKIDSADNIVLDFQNARIRIIGWDNDFIQIGADDYVLASKVPFELEQNGNQIILNDFEYPTNNKFMFKNNTWYALAQYGKDMELLDSKEVGIYDFVINVPREIPIGANAEILKAYGCKFQAVSSPSAEIRNCKLADNYIGNGKSAEVRDTEIGDHAYFKNRILTIRTCESKSIVIGIDDLTGILEGEVREVTGGSIILDAPDYKDLSFAVRDSKLDSFTVNSTNEIGDIHLRNNKIKNVNNNSKIPIQTGDWNGWRY